MGERLKKPLSRREALKRLSYVLAGSTFYATGLGIILIPVVKILQNEGKDPKIAWQELEAGIEKYKHLPFNIGVYPDLDNFSKSEALDRIKKIQEISGVENLTVGCFVTFDSLYNAKDCKDVVNWMRAVDKLNATNMLSVTSFRCACQGHPLALENMTLWQERVARVEKNLRAFEHDFFLRALFEANIRSFDKAFAHARTGEISDEEHAKGFREFYAIVEEVFEKNKHRVTLMPSLWHDNKFSSYVRPAETYRGFNYVSYVVGLEGYSYFRRWFDLEDPRRALTYMLVDNLTPTKMFKKDLGHLESNLAEEVPYWISEVNFADWVGRGPGILYTALLARSRGAQGMVVFDCDKSDLSKWSIYEANWTLRKRDIELLGRIHSMFN